MLLLLQVLIDHKVQSVSLHKELDSLARDRDQVQSWLRPRFQSCGRGMFLLGDHKLEERTRDASTLERKVLSRSLLHHSNYCKSTCKFHRSLTNQRIAMGI